MFALQQWHETAALHRVGDRQAGEIKKRRGEIDVGHNFVGRDAGLDARTADDQGHTQARLVHETLVVQA